jgi:serine/threonine-protein kinase
VTNDQNFKVLQTVATGGTAVLYKAVQVSLDRVVAIKRLHAHLTQDDNFTRRFVLEAKAAASLDHENIVRVIDFGVEEGSYQMVMEFVEGESLKDVLERWRPVKVELALALAHQICRGLEHAHAKGIVHRDIKPGNVMLTHAGVAKITDFGLAKLTQGGTVQTAADSILGTPLYMSPEQAFGESVDQRSDLFSLGTVLYELLTGRQPFASENYMGVIQNIIHKEIPAVRDLNDSVAPAVEAVVMKALAKNRDERFSSAREFREAIERALGLDVLRRATAALPALLERGSETRALSKYSAAPMVGAKTKSSSWSTVSGAKKKHRSGTPMWLTVVVVAVVLGGAAGWGLWRSGFRLDRGDQTIARGEVQQSALAETSGFELAPNPADSPGFASADSTRGAEADTTRGAAMGDTLAAAPPPGAGAATPSESGPGSVRWKAPGLNAPPVSSTPATIVIPVPAQSPPSAPVEAKPQPAAPSEPEPVFREGYLSVNVEPSAQVYVDGVYRGEANPTLRLTLRAGMHSIECRDPRHQPYAETLRIVPGEVSQRTIILKKLAGIISLAATEGAEFYVDGALVGITPITRPIEVPAGTHTLMLKKDRYFTWTSEIVVEPSATLPLRITLSPRF